MFRSALAQLHLPTIEGKREVYLSAKPAFSATSSYWLAARDIYQTMVRLGSSNPLAIGALANADLESAFRTNVIGDQGTAFGAWQWHSDRAEHILQGYGVDVRNEPSLVAQTGALLWEMSTVPAYKPALAAMKIATTAEEAAGIFCASIEGAGAPDAKERREADAAWWTAAIAQHADFFAVHQDP